MAPFFNLSTSQRFSKNSCSIVMQRWCQSPHCILYQFLPDWRKKKKGWWSWIQDYGTFRGLIWEPSVLTSLARQMCTCFRRVSQPNSVIEAPVHAEQGCRKTSSWDIRNITFRGSLKCIMITGWRLNENIISAADSKWTAGKLTIAIRM